MAILLILTCGWTATSIKVSPALPMRKLIRELSLFLLMTQKIKGGKRVAV